MLVKIKVFPGSKKPEIIRKKNDSFDVKIKEKAREGMANKAAISAMASFLKVPGGKIRIIKGFRLRNKIIEIIK
ncbi:MAG: DUF167 domain-containing protein [Candidatus Parcubacteria bacterium]|nr:DUF167 domain-containing protein [Candidatus Parcubacteria bacterium]